MFKDIIVGVSATGVDDCAVKAAVEFAKKFEAKLYLTHVAGMEQGWGSMEHLEPSGETEVIRKRLGDTYRDLLAEVPEAQVLVVPGIAHSELLRLARSKNADLIVLGPHTHVQEEHRGKMWGMAGSTLERVSQRARCPVMIVHHDVDCKEPLFENILVATDFSNQADCAVRYGGQMTRQYKADLTVMHVVGPDTTAIADVNDARTKLQAEYGSGLEGIGTCIFEACEGEPSMEIIRMSREKSSDLIIMAHHSREQDPEKAFLGSTVTQVAQNAPCPTMSVNRHFDLRCGLMYDQSGGVVETAAAEE